jgi:hypothetical protein
MPPRSSPSLKSATFRTNQTANQVLDLKNININKIHNLTSECDSDSDGTVAKFLKNDETIEDIGDFTS